MAYNWMKFGMLCFIASLVFTSCSNDDELGCDIKNSVKKNYKEDADYLAIQLMSDAGLQNDVEIPDGFVDEALTVLSIIEDLNIDETNDVFDKYEVSVNKHYDLQRISVELNTNVGWVNEWQNGNTETGFNGIDNLMSAYELSLDEFVTLSDGAVALISSPKNVNTYALSTRFAGVNGVTYAAPQAKTSQGNNIQINQTIDGYYAVFTVGYDIINQNQVLINDCEGACEFETYYNFNIINCEVDSTYVTGNPAP